MARVNNPGVEPVTLPTRHVAPARGHVDMDNDALRENMRSIGGLVLSGVLSVEFDPDPEEQPKGRKKP